ncbi:PREDICTED: metastasis suppressor protein 1-like isoform X1 [Amphimedon queenslandica]|uniref:IMD domain-containing protein n=1 Tax=Amphimedon queenslandica TaxID=400682 RepID=A0AAN0IXM4_AMPQE|nr:PREDICTED: metastasis suppressor protein 1-like isoform X1 [Amphimedon queenslandica]|eukprot:XP_019849524.1 PREDICTED: metastasis suppressor protein 1-like isoform X1 [Amphimedon queenslandica]
MSEANLEKDLNATGDVFKYLHGSMKASFPLWEDFIRRGHRFQRTLEQLIVSFNSFLDGFAKLADAASQSKGGTKDMGMNLTNIIRWHRAVELKIREINYSLSSKLLTPVGNRIDEWKKSLSSLDKDHDKEMSRVVKETKESIKGTIKVGKTLESKRKKDKVTGALQQQFDQLQLDTDNKIADTELKERVHMSRLMVEERVWFASLSNAFKSVLDNEMTLASDLERLPELVEELKESTGSPSILPEGIRDYVENWQIPPVAKGKLVSQGSSMSLRSGSFSSLDHSSHLSGSTQEMNISAPVHTLGPTLAQPPTHTNEYHQPVNQTVPPPPPPHAPPSVATTMYNATPTHSSYHANQPRPLPEDHYDVPVASAHVSVSPSQVVNTVSLVSSSSHFSAESNNSSTRSASPPYSHLHPHLAPPNTDHTHPPLASYYTQAPMTTPHVAPPTDYRMRTIETDLERPNQFNRNPPPIESSNYIPATLPRPRKGTFPCPPTHPKPTRTYSGSQSSATPLAPPPVPPTSNDDDDESGMSAFAIALRNKQLKRAATVSDRSAPKVH